jgi:hypothetical protein
MSRFSRNVWFVFNPRFIGGKGVDTPVCRFCLNELIKGQIAGKIPHADELGFIFDVFWHKECRVEWLRDLAHDAMTEADRLEMESKPPIKTGASK